MVVGIAGASGSGKDSVAAWLIQHAGFQRIAFADALKDELRSRFRRTLLRISGFVGPYVDAPLGPDEERHLMQPPSEEYRLDWLLQEKPPMVRELLQEFGTEVRRADDPDYWLRAWTQRCVDVPRVVCPDVRFPNEACLITARGGRLLRVDRPGLGVDTHASETSLSTWTRWDAVFTNLGTREDLAAQVAWWWEHP